MNNSGINIDNGLLSASTILTREKCNAHSDDKKNNNTNKNSNNRFFFMVSDFMVFIKFNKYLS